MPNIVWIVLFSIVAAVAVVGIIWFTYKTVRESTGSSTTMVSARSSYIMGIAAALLLAALSAIGIKWAVARRKQSQAAHAGR